MDLAKDLVEDWDGDDLEGRMKRKEKFRSG